MSGKRTVPITEGRKVTFEEEALNYYNAIHGLITREHEDIVAVRKFVSAIANSFQEASAGVENEKRLEATIEELERKVADQAMQIARMEGYLDRVAEDDQVQAGMVEVDQPPILQPRRQGRRHFGSMGSSGGQTIGGAQQANYAETLGRRR